jgi:predicted nucleic acid-binding protein
MSFLLDSDTCSAYLRRNAFIESRFLQYGGRLHVSVITSGELLAWGFRSAAPPSRLATVKKLLGIVRIHDIENTVIERWALIRAYQLDIGKQSPRLDLLIAATALVHNLTLVTHNTKDFANIPSLQIADWLAP